MKLILFFFTIILFTYANENKEETSFVKINKNIDYQKKILLMQSQKINEKEEELKNIKKDYHLLILKTKELEKNLIKKEYIVFILLILFFSLLIFVRIILKENKLYKKLSQIDVLSGLFNRRFMINRIEEEISKYNRTETPFSILLIDIDYFKEVNDQYGHQKGDLVIKKISKLMNEYSRKTDICARWGGEEFIILATNTNLMGAWELAETLRQVVEKNNFEIKIPLTISIGISTYIQGQAQEMVLKSADEKLYKAKENGRNRVEFE